MESLREMICIVRYEMKQQLRSWVFRVFALLVLVGIVVCHVYWQGEGNCVNWRAVALPCSMPLMNAYLFSVVQSLFLIVMMAEASRRMRRLAGREVFQTRPYDNVTYYWGVLVGNFLLFLLLNVIVILVSVLTVNLTSFAPVGCKYYLFYLLTLNIPVWVFVAGMTLWLGNVVKWHWGSIVLPVCWWLGCILVLPYWQHGTLDYTGCGVPTLFSEMVGHLNPGRYALHRLIYLLSGMGLLAWSVSGMKRLPNRHGTGRVYMLFGIMLVVVGVGCGVVLECGFYRDRLFRSGCREAFVRHWDETTCRVKKHAIVLEQEGKELSVQSDMVVVNRNREALQQITLFLNPGLDVTGVQVDGKSAEWHRDWQVLTIASGLEAGDSARVEVDYGGRVDDRFCDIHLTDVVYEDALGGDHFFAQGRTGAFVEESLLLLTPAVVWYPVALPPVNPLMPLATGRDFTRFRLVVKHPLQRVVISQGKSLKQEESIVFMCEEAGMSGISICGANYVSHVIPMDEQFGLQVNAVSEQDEIVKRVTGIDKKPWIALWNDTLVGYNEWKKNATTSWYYESEPYLYLLEVPVSFRLDAHAGKTESGLVEPGMIFWRERGFDMDIIHILEGKKVVGDVWKLDGRVEELVRWYRAIFTSRETGWDSHPFWGIGGEKVHRENDHVGITVWDEEPIRVYCKKYPFMGKMFDKLVRSYSSSAQGLPWEALGDTKEYLDDFIGRSLLEIVADGKELNNLVEKEQDLWMRLMMKIPMRELRASLDSLYDYGEGEVAYDDLMRGWQERWGVDVVGIIEDWITTTHEQYFKVKDAVIYKEPGTQYRRAEAKILNAGRSGGYVIVEYGAFNNVQRSICYIEAGEAKVFTLVTDKDVVSINTGLSANRPAIFNFKKDQSGKWDDAWKLGEEWRTIPVSEFMEREDTGEVVDDQDKGFELRDGNLTWLQRMRKEKPMLVSSTQRGGDATHWKRVINVEAYGDSIRGYHYIAGGKGKSSATWRTNIPEEGRYRVLAKVYKAFTRMWSGDEKIPPLDGIIYYYTLSFAGQRQEVEVNLDVELPGRFDSSRWVSLGEYDLPEGEMSVTLSDKEICGRDEIAIVADAVKFIRLE
ncbi:hypothetical protein AALK14_10190 [Butyricimonas hominis]|uniref:golvesin C-terminal-like domain-containing protein n=1 Tax=Butyricimonas TaxID=574697 RepID=UPI00351896E2